MRSELMEHVTGIMNKAAEHRMLYDGYRSLWVEDRREFMKQFLLHNHVLTPEEIEAAAGEEIAETPPSLQQFREQVEYHSDTFKF